MDMCPCILSQRDAVKANISAFLSISEHLRRSRDSVDGCLKGEGSLGSYLDIRCPFIFTFSRHNVRAVVSRRGE